MRPGRSVVAGCFLASLAGPVFSQAQGPIQEPLPRGATFGYANPGSVSGVWSGRFFHPDPVSSTSGRVVVADPVEVFGPDGKPIKMNVERGIARAALAIGARAVFGPAGALAIAAGSVLWDLLRDKGVVPDSTGKPSVDPGSELIPLKVYRGSWPGSENAAFNGILDGPSAFKEYWKSRLAADGFNGGCTITEYPVQYVPVILDPYGSMKFDCLSRQPDGTSVRYQPIISWSLTGYIKNKCPVTTSTINPISGKPCKTNERRPPTPIELDRAVSEAIDAAPSAQLPGVAGDIVKQGVPLTTDSPAPNLRGPASVDGPSVLADPSAGPGTATAPPLVVREKWPLSYDGPTVTWGPPASEIIPAPVGDPLNPGTPAAGSGASTVPAKTPCEIDPEAIGCSHYGNPDDPHRPGESKSVTFEPVSVSGGGSCPAPENFAAFGKSYSFTFTKLCEQASGTVKSVVLILCACMGAFIFIGGLKS